MSEFHISIVAYYCCGKFDLKNRYGLHSVKGFRLILYALQGLHSFKKKQTLLQISLEI